MSRFQTGRVEDDSVMAQEPRRGSQHPGAEGREMPVAGEKPKPVVANPQLSVEQRRSVLAWGTGAHRIPSAGTAIALIERQVAQSPDRIALVFGETAWTYRELNEQAERLARTLVAAGVGPEVVVGLSVDRSPRMLAAMLAIWKAGGAYLPLDPQLPAARLKYQVENSALRLALVDHDEWAAWSVPGLRVINLRGAEAEPADEATWTGGRPADDPERLAYILYTSGSTGRPKGVEVTQGALVNLLESMQESPGCGPDDVVLCTTTYTFDISLVELFLPLVSGARLVLAESGALLDPEGLDRLMRHRSVTLAQATPSTWWALVQGGWRGGPRVRVITGGEALSADLAAALRERSGAVWNAYGPTETTIYSTIFRVGDSDDPTSIGRPISNTRVYVLDEQRRLSPPGDAGELWISGMGLARGYRGRPDLTAERFATVCVAGTPGETMYATGDLVRWQADGRLKYLGRRDNQVKIRGFRIELGEIEMVLRAQRGVTGAVVIVQGSDDPRLVAYVMAAQGTSLDAHQLRGALLKQLPEYMVPAVVQQIPAFPLTSSGKIDRGAMAAREVSVAPVEGREPQTALERTLGRIFCELLRIDRVDCDTGFLALGGHSLLATRLASRIRRELGVELPIRVVFEHPTVAGLAEWIESQSGGAPVVRPRLTPETRPARLPLSAAQQRMWFLRQFETVASTYHIPLARRLTGPLDVDALRLAVRDLLERHESLRTVFPVEEGEPWQKIVPVDPLSVPLDVVPATMASLADQLQEASIRPFDLASELPIRVTLCVLGPNEHVLLLVLHHIAGDGTSLTPLWRDLSTAYAARLSGEPPAWTPLPLQYADYTLWQQRWLGHAEDPASVTARELQFWREALAGLPDELTLPTDRTRPRVASYRGGAVPIEVGADLLARLQQLARDENASLFMVLQGALAVLLSRLGAGTDIPLGTPIAGRLDETLQDQVGFYVNTLVTRTDLSGEPTFREVLQRVREFDLAAFAHQELPFEQLVQELQPTRSLARHPLFQVMVILQNTGLREESLSGVTVSDMPLPTTTAKFDLLWNLEEQRADGLTGTLEYSVDLFDEESVAVLVRRYVRLLDLVTGAPGQAISALELLDREEHEQLVQWSQGPDRPLPAVAIPDLFARQVAVSPEATAIACQHETWTYRQLDTLSDGIAAQLLAIGLPGDAVVGVCLPRNPGQIAVLLGILKAGGAYLALDPKLPVARLRQMTELAHPFVVVTDEGPCGDLAQQLETQVLIPEYNGAAATRSLPRVSPRTRAYVSFTSGSTGRPKGVEIEHQSVVRLVHEPDYVQLTPGMRVAHFAPLAFDASTFEIWGPLLNGGVCVLIPEEALAFEELERQLTRHRVETMWLTASLFNAIVDERPALLSGLTQVLTGGEALSVSHVRRAREFLGPRVRLINGYGPTECTTFACCHKIRTADCDRGTSIPIGQPIAHTLALVLDAAHSLVPAGVVGELYLGGAGLARGYAGQPELTAERFVADPLGIAADGRLYRTGDLVRWRQDGRLEFVGRTDHQVKIRGFRIELEEIEALLRTLPGVADAAVTVAGEVTGLNARLVAHVVPVPGAALDRDAWQQSLRRQLPEYMVPTVLPPLTALPLTSSGKVDRRELKRLADAESHVSTQTTGRLPQTPTEQTLARIWCELLSREMVDCDTSFFALGGHSLLAVRLFHRLEQALGKKLPLQTLFRSPTVATLAQEFDEPVTQPVTSQVVPLKSGGNRPPLFLLPSATGHLLFWQPLVAQAPPDLPLMGLSLVCDAAGDPLWTTLEATIAPLADAVMARQPEGPIHLLGYSAGAYMAQELARQLEARGRTVGFLGLIDTGPATVAPPTWGERLLMTPGFLRNLAYWSVENNYRVSLRNAARRVRHFGRWVNPRRGDAPVLGRYRRLEKQFLQMLRGHHTRRTAAPITLIRARCQSPWLYRTTDLGWHHYASTVNVRICSGVDHYNIIDVDHMPQLGRMIFESLETAVSPTAPLP